LFRVLSSHKYPWLIGCSLPLPDQTRTDVTLVLLWRIWKARNAKIFEQLVLPPPDVIPRATKDLDIWCHCNKKYGYGRGCVAQDRVKCPQ
jgi:hypothetical protein